MMDYSVVKVDDHNSYIKENRTEHVIFVDLKPIDAKPIARRLNFGGGFAGWTPAFFLFTVPKFGINDD